MSTFVGYVPKKRITRKNDKKIQKKNEGLCQLSLSPLDMFLFCPAYAVDLTFSFFFFILATTYKFL